MYRQRFFIILRILHSSVERYTLLENFPKKKLILFQSSTFVPNALFKRLFAELQFIFFSSYPLHDLLGCYDNILVAYKTSKISFYNKILCDYQKRNFQLICKILRKSYVTMVFDFNHFNMLNTFNMSGYTGIQKYNLVLWRSICCSTENKWYLFTWRCMCKYNVNS